MYILYIFHPNLSRAVRENFLTLFSLRTSSNSWEWECHNHPRTNHETPAAIFQDWRFGRKKKSMNSTRRRQNLNLGNPLCSVEKKPAGRLLVVSRSKAVRLTIKIPFQSILELSARERFDLIMYLYCRT